MKAAWYERNGPASSVLILGEKPIPKPGTGEVLVRLKSSGVNPSDVKSRAGRPLVGNFVIPHSDGGGLIEEIGEGVENNRVGQRVWIWNGQWQRHMGTAAEFICLPSEQAVVLHDSINFETAACLGIPGLTAAHAVNLVLETSADTILVTGAASSVGHYATQMLALAGRRVIGSASGSKLDIVLDAGAAEVIDYKTEKLDKRIGELTNGQGVPAIIDMDFSSTSLLINSGAIAPHGNIVCYGSNDMGQIEVPFRDLLFKSISLKFILVYQLLPSDRQKAIKRLEEFLLSGGAKTRISQTLTLEEIAKSHELVENGTANGNVVLSI